jgi:hypothetical protein
LLAQVQSLLAPVKLSWLFIYHPGEVLAKAIFVILREPRRHNASNSSSCLLFIHLSNLIFLSVCGDQTTILTFSTVQGFGERFSGVGFSQKN